MRLPGGCIAVVWVVWVFDVFWAEWRFRVGLLACSATGAPRRRFFDKARSYERSALAWCAYLPRRARGALRDGMQRARRAEHARFARTSRRNAAGHAGRHAASLARSQYASSGTQSGLSSFIALYSVATLRYFLGAWVADSSCTGCACCPAAT